MVKRRLAGGVILCFALVAPLVAETPTTIIIGTPPQPDWTQLNTQQKNILTPLAGDWDKMENVRRKKWLGIAERYPNMAPNEQGRVQLRMREWANLTPEQRAKARDTYKGFNQLPAEQKKIVKQKWEAYSSLPTEDKQRIRENSKSSRLLAVPAQEASKSPSGEPASQATAAETTSEAGKQ